MDITHPEWLVRAMEAADMKTGELARRSGVNRATIQRMRNGAPARSDTLVRLHKAFQGEASPHRGRVR